MARSKIITGIDIGTGTIKLISILKKPKQREFEILGIKQCASAGVRKGIIVDVENVSRKISGLVKEMESETGREVNNACVGVGGKHIFSVSSKGLVSVSRADQKISENDINRVLQNAKTFPLNSNQEILEIIPKEFIVDGVGGIKEVQGMQGVRLEAEILAVCGFAPYLKNATQAVLNAGISQIIDLVPIASAGARAVLFPEEKELGVVFLDIGAETTNMSVYEEGNLIHVVVFPIGSSNIRNDIAICLKVDVNTAERIKLEFAPSLIKSPKSNKKIKIGVEEEQVFFTEKSLAQIIEARVSEIFDLANKELKKIGRQGLLPGGVVLSGGGANLAGIKEFAKKEFKLPCRIGYPAEGFFENKDPSLSGVLGLVLEEEGLIEQEISSSRFSIIKILKRFFKSFAP